MAPRGLRTLSRSASFHLLSSDTTESILGSNATVIPGLGIQRADLGYGDRQLVEQRNKLFREHDVGTPSILVSFPISRLKPSDKGSVRRVCLRVWLKAPSVVAEKPGQRELDTRGMH